MLVEGKKENHDSYHTGQIQADNDPVEGIHKYSYAVLGDVYAEIASAPMSPRSLIFRFMHITPEFTCILERSEISVQRLVRHSFPTQPCCMAVGFRIASSIECPALLIDIEHDR